MSTDRLRSGDPVVAAVLTAAAAPAEAPLPGEAAALAAFRHFHRPSRRRQVVQSVLRAKVATVAVAGVVLAGGVATAATGTLPGVRSITGHRHSHTHSTGPGSHHGARPATRGGGGAPGSAASPTPSGFGRTPDSGTHGATVSRTAKSPATSGEPKGAVVCRVASDGKCHAPTSAPASPHAGPSNRSRGTTHRTADGQQPRVRTTTSP